METAILYLPIYMKRIKEFMLFSQISHYKTVTFYNLKHRDFSTFAGYS